MSARPPLPEAFPRQHQADASRPTAGARSVVGWLVGMALAAFLGVSSAHASDAGELIGHLQAETETPDDGGAAEAVVTMTPGPDGIVLRIVAADLAPGEDWMLAVHEFGDLSSPEGSSLGGPIDPKMAEDPRVDKPAGIGPAGSGPGLARMRSDEDGVVAERVLLPLPDDISLDQWLGRGISLRSVGSAEEGAKQEILLKGVLGRRNSESDPFLRLEEMRDFSRYRARLQV